MTYAATTEDLILLRERRRRQRAGGVTEDGYAVDPASFITNEVVIDNAQPGDTNAPAELPFVLWPAQADLLAAMHGERLLLILKARQLGISWLACAYALWLCLYHPGRLVLMFSIGQDEANEMMRRVHVMYWRLKPSLQALLPVLVKDNTEEMVWGNGSRIQSLPARRTAGSGYTASLVIMDEFAKNERAREIYTAVKPTIDGGGKMLILSSAHGAGNLFHELVTKAQQGLGRFAFRFLDWRARPGRDDAWYTEVAADAVSDGHMKQEYPATPDEAFEATEVDSFLPNMALWDACQVDDLEPLGPHEPCVLALDGAESDDTIALVIVARHPTLPARLAVRHVSVYTPTPGVVLDDAPIENEIRELCKRYAIRELAYDRALIGQLIRRLTTRAHGGPPPIRVTTEPFHQGQDRLVSDKNLYDLIVSRTLAHGGHAELRKHVANANKKADAGGHIRIVKRAHALKIDACVCLGMACQRAGDLLPMGESFATSYLDAPGIRRRR